MTVITFGYLIILIVDFYDLFSPLLIIFSFDSENILSNTDTVLTTFPNTSRFVKN